MMELSMQSIAGTCRTMQIRRVSNVAPELFYEAYLTGIGKPVIITDALNSWAAAGLWTFDLFRSRYGSDIVFPKAREGSNVHCAKLMKLAEFLNYLDAPGDLASGYWIDPSTLHPCPAPAELPRFPLYLAWNIFSRHPELLDEIELSPKFVEDWLPLLPSGLRKTLDSATRYFSAGVMIGSKNAQIGLHYDVLDTHACLAQIVGKKKCMLFSPDDSAALYDGNVEVDAPKLDGFQLFRQATSYECILEPGEVLFIPWRWWHHVVSLEKSITVNYNFFNRVNFASYLTQLFRDLPTVVNNLAKSPDALEALGIEWTCRGFDFPQSN
jgi:hypothetical protein